MAYPKKCKFPLYVFVAEILVALGDVEAFLRKCREAGAWGIRFFALQSWSAIKLVPFLQAVVNGKPVIYVQPETKIAFPVYDLTKPNPAYWTRFRAILALLKKYGLEAIVSIHDNCSFKGDKRTKFTYPFLCSLQTMSQDEDWPYILPKEARSQMVLSRGGMYGNDRKAWHKAWAAKVRNEIKKSGVKYRIEPVNEFSDLGWAAEGRGDVPVAWYKWFTGAIRGPLGLLVPKNRLVHNGWQAACLPMGSVYCLHNIVRPEDIPAKVTYMLSGDGGTKGRSTTDIDIKGRVGLSVDDGRKIARIIMIRKMGGYDLMPKALNKKSDYLGNVDYFQPDVVAAMTAESLK